LAAGAKSGRAVAVGAPAAAAAASDRMTAAVVVVRWVLIISTCLLLVCRSPGAIGSPGTMRAAGREAVDTGLEPVDLGRSGVSKRMVRW
jgi:hypothetical protein